MTIQTISRESIENRNVTVKLSADDLVMICNALYLQSKEQETSDHFLQLYSDMMMTRDLCQYGHVDNFCLQNVVKCRNDIGEGIGGVLSEKDINVFNAYLEDNDMPTAFENSDWLHVYEKIVGSHQKPIKFLK